MYVVGYDREFQKSTSSGWGCGYVMIPADSRVSKMIDGEMSEDDYCPMWEHGLECTYFKDNEVDGVKYRVVGFDTAHSHNDSSHDFNYVLSQTMKIKAMYEDMEDMIEAYSLINKECLTTKTHANV